jgi:hypothetical protein
MVVNVGGTDGGDINGCWLGFWYISWMVVVDPRDVGLHRHAFSRDGFDWNLTNAGAYQTTVTTADGLSHSFSRRERPHLLFDATGTRPTVLYSTLTNWSTSGANDGHDKAFTFAQPIASF